MGEGVMITDNPIDGSDSRVTGVRGRGRCWAENARRRCGQMGYRLEQTIETALSVLAV